MCSSSDIILGTFKRPDLDTVTDTDLNIDIKKTWADLDKEMIAEGFTAEIRIYDSLKTWTGICEDDMDLLKNVFRKKGGLQDWRVRYPVQWLQKDSVNCGIFVCSAAENEVTKINVQEETLTMTQCRTLRTYHGAKMIKDVPETSFPLTKDVSDEMERQEKKLQIAEGNKCDSNCHCIAWCIGACTFQRVVGTRMFLHQDVEGYKWLQCENCSKWIHFHCAGIGENCTKQGFNCGCTKVVQPNVKVSLEATAVDSMLTDQEIKDLEQKIRDGTLLSNRHYLHKNKEFYPALQMMYSSNNTLLDDLKTSEMINRLKNILPVTGKELEQQMYLEDVILPEVTIQWLRKHWSLETRGRKPPLKTGRCTGNTFFFMRSK
ncbi:uncharacterized protein LOC130212166 [Pseudoliparis swirei]|uniref:uncharacterized protein LOC130212166 n=1 Tax=Pseudoliparis swirei TaxID=2059687 RepID=UPI0024BDB709|nr:uncharacterized protein LOC130212166 [Pseudoliparis swirei]